MNSGFFSNVAFHLFGFLKRQTYHNGILTHAYCHVTYRVYDYSLLGSVFHYSQTADMSELRQTSYYIQLKREGQRNLRSTRKGFSEIPVQAKPRRKVDEKEIGGEWCKMVLEKKVGLTMELDENGLTSTDLKYLD